MPEVVIPEKQLLRYHQREELKQELDTINEAINPSNPWKLQSQADITDVKSRYRRLTKQLNDQTPVELSGAQKDALRKELTALEEKILPGMPTKEEMRKNPAGMVGRHMRWEKANKKDILKWKNGMQMLEPDNSDPDVSNFERLRPEGAFDRLRTDAQIQGHMSYGHIPQENWDKAFEGKGPENTALKQVKKVENSEKFTRL